MQIDEKIHKTGTKRRKNGPFCEDQTPLLHYGNNGVKTSVYVKIYAAECLFSRQEASSKAKFGTDEPDESRAS
jgi:hypothetical protein